MSKMGKIYLDLQEQANELGFDTVEEATNSGLEIQYTSDSAVLVPFLSDQEKAEQQRKEDMLDKVDEAIGHIRFYDHKDSDEHIKNLLEVEQFIKEAR